MVLRKNNPRWCGHKTARMDKPSIISFIDLFVLYWTPKFFYALPDTSSIIGEIFEVIPVSELGGSKQIAFNVLIR